MKALFIVMIAILAMNVSHANYGEDMKGECQKGKDSTRAQEVVVVATGEETVIESGSEVTGK